MATLEDLKAGAYIKGLAPGGAAKVVQIEWFGDQAVKVTYEDATGSVGNRLVYRNEENSLEVVETGRPWSFDGDGALLRLVSEAYRIRLAHLFDPYLAIHTSLIEPLPHQITAVYGEMLPRQPLRFLLADDPGAGKTIMAGLFIKELMIRCDVERCLVVAPGGLVEQWQDELRERLGLRFDILTRDQVEAAHNANPFAERNLLIARLDMLSSQSGSSVQAKSGTRVGPDRMRRGPPHVGELLWRGSEVHQTLPTRTASRWLVSTLSVDDSHTAQRQRGGLSTLYGVARRRSLRGPL